MIPGVNVTDKEMLVVLLARLAAQGVGVWRPTGPVYAQSETGLYYGSIGSQTVRGVALARYGRADFVPGDFYAVKTRRVQVRLRGLPNNPGDADDLAEAVDDVLQGMSRHAGINYVVRLNGPNPLGTDGNGRSEHSLNYSVTLED